MPGEVFEYKITALGNVESKASSVNLDEAQGIVECFVAGIGNKDSVGDIVATGAFTKSLMRRKPRVVWGHNWNDPIGKVLEIYEVPPTDNRLPLKMKMAGIGGLFARVQFNLNSEKGREAFANVAFFGEEQEWSIGYKTLRAQYDQKSQANVIYELELYEVSPVLHGANQLTGTISVKSDGKGGMMQSPIMGMDIDMPDQDEMDREELQKQLSIMLGSKVSITEMDDEIVTYARRDGEGKVGKYKCHYSRGPAGFMFGTPQRVVIAPRPMPMPMPMAMPMAGPGMPTEPQRVVRPSQIPGIPVAIKPGENGMQMVPLPPVEYENEDKPSKRPEFDPNNLDTEEADLRDALLKLVKRYGKFNEDSEGVWAGYKPAAENPVKNIGVKCANCVFFKGGDTCQIIDMPIESEGKCRFAVIPKGVVNADVVTKKSYEYETEANEELYLEDIETKYPGELVVAALRGAIGRRKKGRRKYKSLADFGRDDDLYDSSYCLNVMPQYAFRVKQALDPIFDYYGVETFVDPEGIVITSGVSFELIEAVDTALTNLKKKIEIEDGLDEKALGYRLGRALGSRMVDRPNLGGGRTRGRFFTSPDAQNFNPFTARDVDLDGMVGEGLFMRGVSLAQPDPTPDGPGSIRNPKPSSEQIKKPIAEPGVAAQKISGTLSSGKLYDVPRIDDPDTSLAKKMTMAEEQRQELSDLIPELDDPADAKRVQRAITELDRYMADIEKLVQKAAEKKPKLDRKKPFKEKPAKPKVRKMPTREILDQTGEKPQKPKYDRGPAGLKPSGPDDISLASGKKKPRREATGVRPTRGEPNPAYQKYLNKPMQDRTAEEKLRFDGPFWPITESHRKDKKYGALASGKIPDSPTSELIPRTEVDEDSPLLSDAYKRMADEILRLLEELKNNPNAESWELPWRSPESFARNPVTGRIYQGMNQMILGIVAANRGLELNRWAGISQWKRLGGKLKPDSRDKGVSVLVPVLGAVVGYTAFGEPIRAKTTYKVEEVFHVSDIAGLPEKMYKADDIDINIDERMDDIDAIIDELGVKFKQSSILNAAYNPTMDLVKMPRFEQFKGALEYYGTLMHETIHWTGHSSRLGRLKGGMVFGSESYAFEELIAEIGSAFAMGTLGLSPVVRDEHIQYLAGWASIIKNDPDAVRRAIISAQQANDFILNRSATMRRLAGIPDTERKGRSDSFIEVPIIAGHWDSEKIKPQPGGLFGPIADMFDIDDMEDMSDALKSGDVFEKRLRNWEYDPKSAKRNRDGVVITQSGRLASGGTIKGKRKDVPEIKRTDEKISLKLVFGLSNEPTQEQRDVLDTAIELIRKGDPRIMSILAGAGTGKTTTLRSIAWALKKMFDLWPEGDIRRDEQIKYLEDRFGAKLSGLPENELRNAVEKLKQDTGFNNIFYVVFNRKNEEEAIPVFPREDGISTMDKLFFWSLRLGQGDERYGKKMRDKIQLTVLGRETTRPPGIRRKNPAYDPNNPDPNVPKYLPRETTRTKYDGTTETWYDEEPGWKALGYEKLEDGADWAQSLDIDSWPEVEVRKVKKKIKDPATGKRKTVEVDVRGIVLPNGAFLSVDQMGDLFANAAKRWALSRDEKATKGMFAPSILERQKLEVGTRRGKKFHDVDKPLEEDQVPDKYVENLQRVLDLMMDGNSNMLPFGQEAFGKMWMLTKPDLRTDPGLIIHSEGVLKKEKGVPEGTIVGDMITEADGSEWIVTSVKAKGKTLQAKVTRRVADASRPLSAFFVDEAQDSNEVLEEVLIDNRDRLPIIVVGDDAQMVNAFRGAKNILETLNPDYALPITESFRYGASIAHAANLALARRALYLESVGITSDGWKHVRGSAQTVINRLFDPLLPEADRFGGGAIEEIDDAQRRLRILDIEQKFSTPERILKIAELPRDEQDAALIALRNELHAPKMGKIVDYEEELEKGNFPELMMSRTNDGILGAAIIFLKDYIDSARRHGRLKADGTPDIPEIVIPAKKHEELLLFAKHLRFILLPEAEKKRLIDAGKRPKESPWMRGIWTRERLQAAQGQARFQQLNTAMSLISTPFNGAGTPLGVGGLIQMLEGSRVISTDDKGKTKIIHFAPTLLPERKTMSLDPLGDMRVETARIARGTTAKKAGKAKDSQYEAIDIIPSVWPDNRHLVQAHLEIEGGSDKAPGKSTGRIIISGDGVDTNRPTTLPDGTQISNLTNGRITNGRYRRDLEQVIELLGLRDKVRFAEEVELARRSDSKRRRFDGLIIDGGSLEESSKILQVIGQAMRERAKKTGGDVEITTMTLAKGREARYAVMFGGNDPLDSELTAEQLPRTGGDYGIEHVEEMNLAYVAFSRAMEMLDPGFNGFIHYLHDEKSAPYREAIRAAIERGDMDAELDLGAISDGKIAVAEKYRLINGLSLSQIRDLIESGEEFPKPQWKKDKEAREKEKWDLTDVNPEDVGDVEDTETQIFDSEDVNPVPELDDKTDDVTGALSDDAGDDAGDEDNEDDGPFQSLASGRSGRGRVNRPQRGAQNRRLSEEDRQRLADGNILRSRRRPGRRREGPSADEFLASGENRFNRRAGVLSSGRTQSGISPRRVNARTMAGMRLSGNPNTSEKAREELMAAISLWDSFKRTGIALEPAVLETNQAARVRKTNQAMREVGTAMSRRPNVVVGNISNNQTLNEPSASNWMLPIEKLKDILRVPEEYSIQTDSTTGNVIGSYWTQSRPISNEELATMLSLDAENAARLAEPGAGISHDAVRFLIAEIAMQNDFGNGGWKLFGPLMPTDEMFSQLSPIDRFAENINRTNMRDRFIIETFGKYAFPFWLDEEENQVISSEEFGSLGDVSRISQFRASGRFYRDSADRGDSAAENIINEEAIDRAEDVLLRERGVTVDEARTDKTSRIDFSVEPLLENLGISREQWKSRLSERLSNDLGVPLAAIRDSVYNWESQGIPIPIINTMIKKGIIPSAASVWKDGNSGARLDSELRNKRHVVYEALNEFMDKQFGGSKLNSTASRKYITQSKTNDMGTVISRAIEARGYYYTGSKGASVDARYSMDELQQVVNRLNEVFGTEHTIDDIFSDEQMETARKRIEEDRTTLWKPKVPKKNKGN